VSEPRWTHDCTACRYIGRLLEYDLYVCPQQAVGWPTIVARYGNDGAEYTSGSTISLGGPHSAITLRLESRDFDLEELLR
jgi:hypothetical protein